MATHQIVHVEIPAADIPAVAQFYADTLGWKLDVAPEYNYYQWSDPGGSSGGFVSTQMEEPGYPTYKAGELLVYLNSDDIDADLAKVEQNGGKILYPKFEIPMTGWMGVWADPAGNRLAFYTAMNPQS